MQTLKQITILLICITFISCGKENVDITTFSPNTNLALKTSIKDGVLSYTVTLDGKTIVAPSKLGFKLKSGKPFNKFTAHKTKRLEIDRTWENIWGENKTVKEEYNQLLIELEDQHQNRKINFRIRAFDDGVAFRFEFPKQENLTEFAITDELTEFNFTANHNTWWQKADFDTYENLYEKTRLKRTKNANTPLTMKSKDGHYISIHEANLTNYSGMTLKKKGDLGFEADLVPWKDSKIKVKAKAPFKTPWRTIQITKDAGKLIESDLLLCLNESNKLEHTKWIKPMKYIGIWWGIHIGVHTWTTGDRHGATTERAMQYIDFAAQNNIQAVLFEGWNKGWDEWGKRDAYLVPAEDFDLKKVARYAKEKDIQIIGHNETGGNVEAYEKFVEEIFEIYADLGIKAVKTGYVGGPVSNGEHHHGQWMVNHYRRIVELAAKYEIMLDVHEPIKPTGLRRTYPNMMTREGVRGGEWNAWSEGNPPEHTLIIPFTRMLAGPVDYTPGIFDLRYERYKGSRHHWNGSQPIEECRTHTTLARQLANMVILYSPLQMAADMIENYDAHPAFEFIKKLNVNYDKSLVPSGEIGEHIVVARKAGKEWFVGAATNDEAREIKLKFDFLTPETTYKATIYRDADSTDWLHNPTKYTIDSMEVNQKTEIQLKLPAGGGQAIYLQQQ